KRSTRTVASFGHARVPVDGRNQDASQVNSMAPVPGGAFRSCTAAKDGNRKIMPVVLNLPEKCVGRFTVSYHYQSPHEGTPVTQISEFKRVRRGAGIATGGCTAIRLRATSQG